MKRVECKHSSVNLKTAIKKIKQKIKRTTRQNRKIGRSNHSLKQIAKQTKTTQRVKIKPLLKPIKTDYKTWTLIVKTAKTHPKKNSFNIRQKNKSVLNVWLIKKMTSMIQNSW